MPEARNPAALRSPIETLKLQVAAFDASDFNDRTIDIARAAGRYPVRITRRS